jgi:hypothetical protein
VIFRSTKTLLVISTNTNTLTGTPRYPIYSTNIQINQHIRCGATSAVPARDSSSEECLGRV